MAKSDLPTDPKAVAYLKALEKQRRNQDRSTGTRKTDAQVRKEQTAIAESRKKASQTEAASRKPKPAAKSAPRPPAKSSAVRDAPAYRGSKSAPKPAPTVAPTIKPTGGWRIPQMPDIRKAERINKERSGPIGVFPSAKKKK